MKRCDRLFILICVCGLGMTPKFNSPLLASDYGLAGEFLNFGAGARPLALGGAFTGVADDVDSLFWNPAGLSTYRSQQVAFQYSPLSLGGAHQTLAYSQPFRGYGSLGVGVVNLTSGDVPRTDDNNIENGSFQSRETGYLLSYAYRIRQKLGLGASLKMVEKVMDSASARGVGADLGVLWTRERVRFGVMLRNLVPPSYSFSTEKETFPTILRAGTGVNFLNKQLLGSFELEKTLGTPQGMKWHLGVEGILMSNISLRAGVNSSEFTTGFGVRWKAAQMDYAAGFQEFGLSNRTSIKVFFGGYDVDVKASPRVFSPLGLNKKAAFKIAAGNRSRAVSWILTIRDANGEVVRSFNGYNAPPKVLEWDGTNAQEQPVADGEYTYRMAVTDKKNVTETSPARTVKIASPTPLEIEAR